MSEFTRQHPVATVTKAIGLIRANFFTIVIFVFVGAGNESVPFLWWFGIGFILLLLLGIASWWRFLYQIVNGELHIKSGIFVRKNLYLTSERVQVIDITSGIIQRLFGLVRVDIQTAGSTSREAALEAVTLDEAKRIKQLLRKAGQESEQLDSEENRGKSSTQKISLPGKELVIAASTSGSFGIALSVIGTIFSQLEPLFGEMEWLEKAIDILPASTNLIFYAQVILVFIFISWLFSFFSTLFKFGDFSLTVKEDEMIITRGIFEKKRITIPFNRIQAVQIKEGLVRQPLGYAAIHIDSAGYGDEMGSGSIVLFPLMKKERIKSFLEEVLPDFHFNSEGITPPGKALRRYIIRSAFIPTVLTASLYWTLGLNLMIWIIPLIAIFWGWKKHGDASASFDGNTFMLKSRMISLNTAYINKNRVQDSTVRDSFIQRYKNLSNINFSVASGEHGRNFSVTDLEHDEAVKIVDGLKRNPSEFTSGSR